jgi:hypothetical protein
VHWNKKFMLKPSLFTPKSVSSEKSVVKNAGYCFNPISAFAFNLLADTRTGSRRVPG